mgnify:CR=1 FL=1
MHSGVCMCVRCLSHTFMHTSTPLNGLPSDRERLVEGETEETTTHHKHAPHTSTITNHHKKQTHTERERERETTTKGGEDAPAATPAHRGGSPHLQGGQGEGIVQGVDGRKVHVGPRRPKQGRMTGRPTQPIGDTTLLHIHGMLCLCGPLSLSLSHTHTHTLSLSLSLCQYVLWCGSVESQE